MDSVYTPSCIISPLPNPRRLGSNPSNGTRKQQRFCQDTFQLCVISTHGEDARHLRVEQAGHAAKHDQACERRHPQQSQFVAGCEHFLVDKGRITRLY